jgi:hypothetical protein
MTTRERFRALVEDLAAKAQATLPDSQGRIASAVKLVLNGDVVLEPDGLAIVGSATTPGITYTVNGTCACPDVVRAPEGWCKHRIARALQIRTERAMRDALDAEGSRMPQDARSSAQAPTPTLEDDDPAWNALAPSREAILPVTPQTDTAETGRGDSTTAEASGSQDAASSILSGFSGGCAAPLPEAPASANCHILLAGRQVQITLRDTDETRLLARLELLLQRFPVETTALVQAPTTPPPPVCQWHGRMKESTKAQGTWYCPSRMADGSYCQERWPAKGRG